MTINQLIQLLKDNCSKLEAEGYKDAGKFIVNAAGNIDDNGCLTETELYITAPNGIDVSEFVDQKKMLI